MADNLWLSNFYSFVYKLFNFTNETLQSSTYGIVREFEEIERLAEISAELSMIAHILKKSLLISSSSQIRGARLFLVKPEGGLNMGDDCLAPLGRGKAEETE